MNLEITLTAIRRSPLGKCVVGMTDAETLSKCAFWLSEYRRMRREVTSLETFLLSGRADVKDPDTFAVFVVNSLTEELRRVLELNLKDVPKEGALQ